MQVPMTGTAIRHELASVLDEVVSAGYAMTDEVRAANVTRLSNLYQPLFALDTSGSRGASAAVESLRQAHSGLEQIGTSGGMIDFRPFIDGISATLKAAIDIA